MELGGNLSNGGTEGDAADDDDMESSCSTPPYCSAPSSPRGGSYFFSAPASPLHFVLSSSSSSAAAEASAHASASGSFEFEFSARGSAIAAADEIFLNGQIRPMKLSSHLQQPQIRPDPSSTEGDEAAGPRGRDPRLRSRSIHRRARSMSPLRNQRFPWHQEEDEDGADQVANNARPSDPEAEAAAPPAPSVDTAPASSSSRSSSTSGRSSKRWIFLKDLLHRSKSEGRGNGKEKFWMSLSSFSSPSKERSKPSDGNSYSGNAAAAAPQAAASDSPAPTEAADLTAKTKAGSRAAAVKKLPANGGVAGGRVRGSMMASAHERHYTWNRAQAEEMRRRTFLPYRHGVLGFLWFGSRGINGFARTPNPVSSR